MLHVALGGAAAALLSRCAPITGTATPSILRIGGANAMSPLLHDLHGPFTEQYPSISLEILESDTAVGLELLERGEIDMAAVSWDPQGLPKGWVATPIAWDGIAVIVHSDSPVDGVTLLQLQQIFAGWLFRWGDLGAIDANEEPIQVLSREEGSGTRAVFESHVMGQEDVTLTALVMPNSQAMLRYVAEHPNAIGYISMGWIDDSVKVLAVEDMIPTPESVLSGYHLARPLYLVTPGEPQGEARLFIDFALSGAGQAIIGQKYGRVR
ncbi:MAG: phosphate ABC transporter substrate-binding protein [Anaerolineae bacterium]